MRASAKTLLLLIFAIIVAIAITHSRSAFGL